MLQGHGEGVEADAAIEALLDAVSGLLSRHGTERWSMDDVAETLVRLELSHLMVPTSRFGPGDLRAVLAPLLWGGPIETVRPRPPGGQELACRG